MESQRRCGREGLQGSSGSPGGGGQGTALEAQGAQLVPTPHHGSPLRCTLLSHPLLLTAAFRELPGVPASAVSLIRASQPPRQGVGAPSPGMALDKQLELSAAESAISKGDTETNHWSQGDG